MKIATIVGARPQFIKHAPLGRELAKSNQCILLHTGQHYDYNMSKVFFDELSIPTPDYNLGIGSGSHAYQTGEMMKSIEDILIKENPDLVLIYGDTNSTLAGALAAVKLHIKIAHVEAGLRVFDKTIPEEINRVVADCCSDYLFCPTQTAYDNLKHENVTRGVYLTGDVMVDALNYNIKVAEKSGILHKYGLIDHQYIVVTLHRAGNTDSPEILENIVKALIQLSESGESLIFPVHPRTEKVLAKSKLLDKLSERVKLIAPLGYLDFLNLMSHAKKILTDSGGIQKEAYILKIPCITLMDFTPWVETMTDGWNVMAGTETEKIFNMVKSFNPTIEQRNVFGNRASSKIAAIING